MAATTAIMYHVCEQTDVTINGVTHYRHEGGAGLLDLVDEVESYHSQSELDDEQAPVKALSHDLAPYLQPARYQYTATYCLAIDTHA